MKRITFLLTLLCVFLPGSKGEAGRPIKIYGNWCGPKHGFKGKPIDEIDEACKAHDICCKKEGHKSFTKKFQHCRCDAILIRKLHEGLRKVAKKIKKLNSTKPTRRLFRRKPRKRLRKDLEKKRKALLKKLGKARIYGIALLAFFNATGCFCEKRVCTTSRKCKKHRKCTVTGHKRKCIMKTHCRKVRTCKKRVLHGIGGKCSKR